MRRLVTVAGVILAAALGGPARAEVLIGLAGPITGKDAWIGEQLQRGAELAVADLNAAGGVLGQQVRLITADDFCDPEQAVAAAKKLVSDGVIFVDGHFCSHASIPASEVYEAAGVLQISPSSSNPMLTDLGRANVFRVTHRDDAAGVIAGNYLADRWPDKKIAILHDNTTFGKGIAEETKKQLNRRGLKEAIYQAYIPGGNNYAAEIAALRAAEIDVLYIGGYHTEIALMARLIRDRGYLVQLVTGSTLATEEFGLIAGPAAEGALFIDPPDPRRRAEAEPLVERFRTSGFEPEGYTLLSYGAVQVWGQAAEKAGSLELQSVIAALRAHQFDTVLGPIAFDDKGDLAVQNPVWYVWRGGSYAPLE
ncbi:MAG TPA: branched-chain amino acid ABC transporter substrate-binding protein [Geminicoccaceae bacterium]|nr:branched-chain amino acid ABC transporter substrate-binding protein [Geminicoccaceae bacterium]